MLLFECWNYFVVDDAAVVVVGSINSESVTEPVHLQRIGLKYFENFNVYFQKKGEFKKTLCPGELKKFITERMDKKIITKRIEK